MRRRSPTPSSPASARELVGVELAHAGEHERHVVGQVRQRLAPAAPGSCAAASAPTHSTTRAAAEAEPLAQRRRPARGATAAGARRRAARRRSARGRARARRTTSSRAAAEPRDQRVGAARGAGHDGAASRASSTRAEGPDRAVNVTSCSVTHRAGDGARPGRCEASECSTSARRAARRRRRARCSASSRRARWPSSTGQRQTRAKSVQPSARSARAPRRVVSDGQLAAPGTRARAPARARAGRSPGPPETPGSRNSALNATWRGPGTAAS